jgi:hypothetical protein
MARIVCSKCGATGFSKCPSCRTVFPDNEYEGILSWFLTYQVSNGQVEIIHRHPRCEDISRAEDIALGLTKLRDRLNRLAEVDPGFKQYSCEHDWWFAKGERSDIGCGCPVKTIDQPS